MTVFLTFFMLFNPFKDLNKNQGRELKGKQTQYIWKLQ